MGFRGAKSIRKNAIPRKPLLARLTEILKEKIHPENR